MHQEPFSIVPPEAKTVRLRENSSPLKGLAGGVIVYLECLSGNRRTRHVVSIRGALIRPEMPLLRRGLNHAT